TVAALSEHGLADTVLRKGHKHGTTEFRYPGYSWVMNYGALADGDVHTIYSQSELNDDLIGRYLGLGGDLRLRHEALALDARQEGVTIEGRDLESGEAFSIECELAVSCDGYHGIGRRSLPAGAVESYEKQYPYRWLAILAHCEPSSEHVI